ncbi:MAG: DUF2934 domain-containing protein [Hyphomicrobiales bacterium]|nr:DUF2934 domain-containing protein [Hyphomicrobiales bacterium]
MEREPQGGESGGRSARSQICETDERRIRQRAHEIRIEDGKPERRGLKHWLRAKWELEQAPDPKDAVGRLEQDFAERNNDK